MTKANPFALSDTGAIMALAFTEQGIKTVPVSNELALMQLNIELKVLQQQKPKTPEQHRDKAELIVWIGQVISMIEAIEGEDHGNIQRQTLPAEHAQLTAGSERGRTANPATRSAVHGRAVSPVTAKK